MTTPQDPVPPEAEASAVVGKQEPDAHGQAASLVPEVPHGAFLRVDEHASAMTLGGRLKHLVFVEFIWFEATALHKPTSQPWVDVDWDAAPDWDGREHTSLRWILVHMFQRYARHNGHADLLPEQIDGQSEE